MLRAHSASARPSEESGSASSERRPKLILYKFFNAGRRTATPRGKRKIWLCQFCAQPKLTNRESATETILGVQVRQKHTSISKGEKSAQGGHLYCEIETSFEKTKRTCFASACGKPFPQQGRFGSTEPPCVTVCAACRMTPSAMVELER